MTSSQKESGKDSAQSPENAQNSGAPRSRRQRLRLICAWPLIALVQFYRTCISPYKTPCCRFTPTCSQYALEALRKYGPLKGSWLALRRILRCHPLGGSGYDPVP